MTEVERLEAERQQLNEAKKENGRKLRAAKRKEARKQAQAQKEAEQAEAVLFLAFCKQHEITFGRDENRYTRRVYDWLRAEFEKWKQDAQTNGAPGRAQ